MNPLQAMLAAQSQPQASQEDLLASAKIIYPPGRGIVDIIAEGQNIGNVVEVRHFTKKILAVRTVHTADAHMIDLSLPAPAEDAPASLVEINKTTYLPASEIKRIVTDPRSDQPAALALAEDAVATWQAAAAECA